MIHMTIYYLNSEQFVHLNHCLHMVKVLGTLRYNSLSCPGLPYTTHMDYTVIVIYMKTEHWLDE